MAVLGGVQVLVDDQQASEREGVIRGAQLLIVEVDLGAVEHLVDVEHRVAVVVGEDEDEAELARGVHRLEVEATGIVEDKLEAVLSWQDIVAVLGHDSLGPEV